MKVTNSEKIVDTGLSISNFCSMIHLPQEGKSKPRLIPINVVLVKRQQFNSSVTLSNIE